MFPWGIPLGPHGMPMMGDKDGKLPLYSGSSESRVEQRSLDEYYNDPDIDLHKFFRDNNRLIDHRFAHFAHQRLGLVPTMLRASLTCQLLVDFYQHNQDQYKVAAPVLKEVYEKDFAVCPMKCLENMMKVLRDYHRIRKERRGGGRFWRSKRETSPGPYAGTLTMGPPPRVPLKTSSTGSGGETSGSPQVQDSTNNNERPRRQSSDSQARRQSNEQPSSLGHGDDANG